jgi:hypothetical protein
MDVSKFSSLQINPEEWSPSSNLIEGCVCLRLALVVAMNSESLAAAGNKSGPFIPY